MPLEELRRRFDHLGDVSPIAVVENGAAPLPPGSRTVSGSGKSVIVGSL